LTYWQKYFNYPTGAQLGIFNGTQGLGSVFAVTFLWWLVEKVGRRITIMMGAVIIIIGVFIQSFATSLAMFVINSWGSTRCSMRGALTDCAILGVGSLALEPSLVWGCPSSIPPRPCS